MIKYIGFLVVLLLLNVSTQTHAQTWNITKAVIFDPTTYAPTILAHTAMRMDWDTSQPFFRNGWNEVNPKFTLSGQSYSPPLSHAAGNRKIRQIAALYLFTSVAHNYAIRGTERMLIRRLPEHAKLVRIVGWTERIGFAAFLTYLALDGHLAQAQKNRRLARELGYLP